MKALLLRLALGVLALVAASVAAGAQEMSFSTVPPDPMVASSGPVAIAYSGSSGGYLVCYTEWDCWLENWYADVEPATLSLLVNGRQSASLLHVEGETNNCNYYYDGYGRIESYDCQYSGSMEGTIGWATGAPVSMTATMNSTYGPVTATHGFGPNIEVTPDARLTIRAGGGWYTEPFTVRNNASAANTFSVTTTCAGAMVSCSGPSSVYVGAGASALVNVSYQATAYTTANPNGLGTTTLRVAAGAYVDTGTVTIQTVPVVSVQSANPNGDRDLDNCLTFSGGMNVAAQCGDLRVTHVLPSVRTNGKLRTLSMLYNSRTAQAMPVILADVRIPAGMATPTRVTAAVYAGPLGTTPTFRASGEWRGSDFVTGSVRRIGFSYAASSDSSGAYGYQVRVTFWQGATPSAEHVSDDGAYVLVNRRTSPYGAGWWPAGVERLVLPTSGDMSVRSWIGGDGSTRLYRQVRPSVWMAGAIDRPDSLTFDTSEGYVRWGPHKLQVKFDALGRHIMTLNRNEELTQFEYDPAAPFRLKYVRVPKINDWVYTFAYDWTGSEPTITVTSLSATVGGAPRQTMFVLNSGGSTGSIGRVLDPDQLWTYFSYYGAEGNPTQLSARTGKGRTIHYFYYQAASYLGQITVAEPLGAYDVLHQFPQVAELGGMNLPGQQVASADPQSDALATLRTGARFNAGQNGSEYLYAALDRFGAPRKLWNYQNTTLIERGDGRFPGLVTQVTAPSGSVTRATYDDRGNVLTSTAATPYGDGRDAVTQYAWDRQWDFPASITQPEGERMEFGYNSNGNRIWQQDGRGESSRTSFFYMGTFLSVVQAPGASCPDWWYGIIAGCQSYTPNNLGNVAQAITELGHQTYFQNDLIGRTWHVRSQIDSGSTALWQEEQSTLDVMDRETLHVSTGPAMNGAPQESLYVRSELDAEGAPRLVERWSSPDTALIGHITTQFIRDGFGRVVKEIAPDSASDSTKYDPSGNVTRRITRNGKIQEFEYDGLNRLSKQIMPEYSYAAEVRGLGAQSGNSNIPLELRETYPFVKSTQGGYLVPADTATFVYSAAGLLTDANNRNALVHRNYYPGGQLMDETQQLHTWAAGTSFPHSYATSYSYDRNGRRTQVGYPTLIGPQTGSVVTYQYSGLGDLAQLIDLHGNPINYTYDSRSQLTRREMPGHAWESMQYRSDGALSTQQIWVTWNGATGTGYPRNQSFRYDARGKQTAVLDYSSQATDSHGYDGLGQLRTSSVAIGGTVTSPTYTSDALGNVTYTVSAEASFTLDGQSSSSGVSPSWNYYRPSTGRQWLASEGPYNGQLMAQRSIVTEYDPAGNTTWTGRPSFASMIGQVERRMYYGADNMLAAIDARSWIMPSQGGWSRSFEEYRYDALGRRVLVRMHRNCANLYDANLGNTPRHDCKAGGIRRTIWDGAQELGEIQMPDILHGVTRDLESDVFDTGTSAEAVNMEVYYGTVAYQYDGRTDQPVAVTRSRYLPLFNWGGTLAPNGFQPFTFYPLWNQRGQPDQMVPASGVPVCNNTFVKAGDVTSPSCVFFNRVSNWSPYARMLTSPGSWHGSLLEDKNGASGLMFRRNRYYDPGSGRFTQEDPIGLAGGMNLYGFAAGDPVNFSDPFGLCPVPADDCPPGYWTALGTAAGAIIGGTGGGAGGFLAGFGVGAIPGGMAGAAQGATLGGAAGAFADGIIFANRQGRAVGKAESYLDHINKHFGNLEGEPDGPAANGWRKELRAAIDNVGKQLKDMKGKTAEEWAKRVEEMRQRLNDLTPK